MRSFVSFVAGMALFASSSFAQEVTFDGKVEDGENVCYYCPGFDFVLDNTHVSLVSPTIALLPLVGQYVHGTGMWNGSTTAPKITVTAIQVVAQSFSIGGNGSIGGEMQFTVNAVPGSSAIALLAFKDGFVPFGSWGTLFLAPSQMIVLGQGTTDGGGEFSIDIDIPDQPALIGLQVFGQGAVVPPSGLLHLTNSDLKILD
jgi:hypothetical protein